MDPAAIEEARRLIETAELADPATINEIGATLRFTAEGEWASRELLEDSATTDVLWAALWVYASAGSDPAPLRPLLTHESPSIRAIAAASLISLGEVAGFDVLQEDLANEHQLLGSEPPISIQLFALQTLQGYVSADDAPAEPSWEDEVAGAATGWSTWLEGSIGQLRFDATQGLWAR